MTLASYSLCPGEIWDFDGKTRSHKNMGLKNTNSYVRYLPKRTLFTYTVVAQRPASLVCGVSLCFVRPMTTNAARQKIKGTPSFLSQIWPCRSSDTLGMFGMVRRRETRAFQRYVAQFFGPIASFFHSAKVKSPHFSRTEGVVLNVDYS